MERNCTRGTYELCGVAAAYQKSEPSPWKREAFTQIEEILFIFINKIAHFQAFGFIFKLMNISTS